MSSFSAVFGVVSLGAFLTATVAILQRLGADGLAKGLFILTLALFALVLLATYLPAVLSGV